MRHVLSALVMNQPGVLAHVSGMLASRAFNIDSLAVGATENPRFSRMTFVIQGDDRVLEQVRKQLEKLVNVVRVLDYQNTDMVDRDLMLVKVSTAGVGPNGEENPAARRTEIRELVDVFRGKIVDLSPAHLMVELSGQESKIEAFIDLVRPFGILELVRTGRVALARRGRITEGVEDAPDDADAQAEKAAEIEAAAAPAAA
ncbi:acetolactate synthase small subunit [Alienimonas californiensis]|uniref:Acetolactate synthase small subunit n=1 Tax=Alienimonas californiensis TaxID=2527989 RepID=A0A517P6Y8_9PLAN|nr:acetolactate synthase small subunit [Alienimonas californiensis]QDT15147.1 Putative acetolactate synthase small subunit [Alienimonas californiensis]